MKANFIKKVTMKLQAKDLMIGDWVLAYGKKTQIVWTGNIHNAAVRGFPHEFYEDELQPIPLTPEILEKNGWRYDETNKAYLWKDGNYYISIDLHGKTRVYVCNDYILGLPVDCVHELQHALKLCGIEKEIEL